MIAERWHTQETSFQGLCRLWKDLSDQNTCWEHDPGDPGPADPPSEQAVLSPDTAVLKIRLLSAACFSDLKQCYFRSFLQSDLAETTIFQ